MTTPHPPPSPQQMQYIAVGRCSKLSAPAIFCSWNDCREYVELGNNGNARHGALFYQSFGSMPEAVRYIESFTATNPVERTSNGAVQKHGDANENIAVAAATKPPDASSKSPVSGQEATQTAPSANQSNQSAAPQVSTSSSGTGAPGAASATSTHGNYPAWQYPTPGYTYPAGTTPYSYTPWHYPPSYYPAAAATSAAQAPAASTPTNAAPAPVTPAKPAPISNPSTPSEGPPSQTPNDSLATADKTSSEIDAAANTPDQTTSGDQPLTAVTPSPVTAPSPTDPTVTPAVDNTSSPAPTAGVKQTTPVSTTSPTTAVVDTPTNTTPVPSASASMPVAAPAPAPAAGYYHYPYYNYYPHAASTDPATSGSSHASYAYPYSYDYYGAAAQGTSAIGHISDRKARQREADAIELMRLQSEEDNKRHNEDIFDEHLATLAEYKKEYGDCNVPVVRSSQLKSHSHVSIKGDKIDMVKYYYLGLWLKDVKVQFKIFDLKPAASSLTRDQMRRLREVGFGPGGDLTSKKIDTSLPITVKRFPSLASDKPEKNAKKALWDEEKFISLQQFVQAMGHADVPQSTESKISSPISRLRRWLNDLQEAYQKIEDGEATLKSSSDNDEEALTAEHVARMKAAGFDLKERAEAYRLYRKAVTPPSFEDKVMDWLHYRSSNGGVDPPAPSKGEKAHPVGTWISLVRRKYKQMQQQEDKEPPKRKSSRGTFVLTKDRVDKLSELGFKWDERKSGGRQLDFEARVQELLDFERAYGHLNVPQNEKGLGTWVKTQRSQYRKFFRGETTFITQERIDRLNEIGFDFDPKVRGNRKPRSRGSKKSKKRKNALPMHKKSTTRAAPGKRRKMQQQEEPDDLVVDDDEPLFSSSSDESEDDDDNSVESVESHKDFSDEGMEDAEEEVGEEEEEGPLVIGDEDEIDIDIEDGGSLVVV